MERKIYNHFCIFFAPQETFLFYREQGAAKIGMVIYASRNRLYRFGSQEHRTFGSSPRWQPVAQHGMCQPGNGDPVRVHEHRHRDGRVQGRGSGYRLVVEVLLGGVA